MTRIVIIGRGVGNSGVDIDMRVWSIVRQWKFLEPLQERQKARAYYCGKPMSLWQLREAINRALAEGDAAWLMSSNNCMQCSVLVTREAMLHTEMLVRSGA